MNRGERGPHGDHGQTGHPGRAGEKGDTGARGERGERGDRETLPLAVRYATAAWLIMAAGVVAMGAWLYYDKQADDRKQVATNRTICSVATHNRDDLNNLKDSLRRAYTLPFIPRPSSNELMKTVPPDRPPITCSADGKINLSAMEDVVPPQQGP